ncbi:molybdopterin-dependent oxidoreductase [Dietzia sp. DQ12-45-1b]|uniref:molybdopterin-dependent oxidoreductase n=4 Tax=Dietzia TaxID=37914 RepID=UPI000D209A0A|nr:molybdopterin-dependent oxidoreductase [Dietzia sp. DQ12-45-1b]AVZ40631.1 oxidoreductase [Dietzia sp. JS16-p6b]QGW26195.1 oxidoreductase molybdopterin-binding protein [Dietzia sp. DQ12-45-1b]
MTAQIAAGVLATGIALAVGHAMAGLVAPGSSPFLAVADSVVDRAPSAVREATIDALGTADKPALLIGLAGILAVMGVVIGLTERPRRPIGSVLIIALGLTGVLAAATRPSAGLAWVLPTLAGTVLAVVALRLMVGALFPASGDGTGGGSGDGSGTGSGDLVSSTDEAPASRPGPDRRRFLVLAGSAVAVIAAAGATGVAVTRRAADALAERAGLRLPRVLGRNAAPPVPDGVVPDAPGVTPFLTSNEEFYRIDTALRVPALTTADWRLRIHGMVDREIELDWQSLTSREFRDRIVTLTCVSNEVGGDLAGTATWTGFPIDELLAEAGPLPEADMLLSTSVDGWTAGTPLEALTDGRDALLAVGMNGEPLPLEHGYPVRQVVPGLYGYVSATKWVVDWEVTRFDRASAYWTDRGWGERGPILTASRIDRPAPLAQLDPGPVVVAGTAWAQHRGIDRVEVRVDDGPWNEAALAEEYSIDTWRMWSWTWDAEPGLHTLSVRATDSTGEVQTETRQPPIPTGATGWHNRTFRVSGT